MEGYSGCAWPTQGGPLRDLEWEILQLALKKQAVML